MTQILEFIYEKLNIFVAVETIADAASDVWGWTKEAKP